MTPTYTDRFMIRLAPQTAAQVREQAQRKGSTVSDLLRSAIRRELQDAA